MSRNSQRKMDELRSEKDIQRRAEEVIARDLLDILGSKEKPKKRLTSKELRAQKECERAEANDRNLCNALADAAEESADASDGEDDWGNRDGDNNQNETEDDLEGTQRLERAARFRAVRDGQDFGSTYGYGTTKSKLVEIPTTPERREKNEPSYQQWSPNGPWRHVGANAGWATDPRYLAYCKEHGLDPGIGGRKGPDLELLAMLGIDGPWRDPGRVGAQTFPQISSFLDRRASLPMVGTPRYEKLYRSGSKSPPMLPRQVETVPVPVNPWDFPLELSKEDHERFVQPTRRRSVKGLKATRIRRNSIGMAEPVVPPGRGRSKTIKALKRPPPMVLPELQRVTRRHSSMA